MLGRLLTGALDRLSGIPPVCPHEFDLQSLPGLLKTTAPTILEIGCNDGSHTREFLNIFPNARIFAFEPDERARERFKGNVRDERVTLVPIAISANDGDVEFYPSGGAPSDAAAAEMPKGWDLSGSIRRPKEHLHVHSWCNFGPPTRVPSRRLDTWCHEQGIDEIDFIWADVQGAEGDLIDGGPRSLARTRYIYTEYSNSELYERQINLRELLKRLSGFSVVKRFPTDVLLKNLSLL